MFYIIKLLMYWFSNCDPTHRSGIYTNGDGDDDDDDYDTEYDDSDDSYSFQFQDRVELFNNILIPIIHLENYYHQTYDNIVIFFETMEKKYDKTVLNIGFNGDLFDFSDQMYKCIHFYKYKLVRMKHNPLMKKNILKLLNIRNNMIIDSSNIVREYTLFTQSHGYEMKNYTCGKFP
jgi:hypothetical protein